MMNMSRTIAVVFVSTMCVITRANDTEISLFDMEAIRDASTLDAQVIQDWHVVDGDVPTRQKLITIHVGEFWPGRPYRVPVRMVVPADRKAKGFHLTGGNMPEQLHKDVRLRPIDKELLRGGVGLVFTVVQVLERSGQGPLGQAVHERFIETLNPRVTVKYWGWPASLMRCVTVAHAETEHFEVGKVALSGGSKNGASPSIAIIHDDRMTAVHSSVAPIWDSPLRLCDRDAWQALKEYNKRDAEQLAADTGRGRAGRLNDHAFLGGLFGPIYNNEALAAGHRWEDLSALAHRMADHYFLSRNAEALAARNVDLLFHPGTHDFVAYDVPWGGKHHPNVPAYLKANSGHGIRKAHPAAERIEENRSAFLLQHFFDDAEPMLYPPAVAYKVSGDRLQVSVAFDSDAGAENGRIWWMFDRGPDGSAAYIRDLIPDDQWAEMHYDDDAKAWVAEIDLESGATHIDFFSNHRKTMRYGTKEYRTYISSPYTRVAVPTNVD